MSFPHACMVLFGEIAVPRDVPLPLPLDEKVLKAVIIAAFLLHLLFVNLMVGGSILTFLYELIGLRRPKYDVLAQRIAATVTVNKSVAVVLGVGPLLMISLAYTVQWYAANSLTSYAWLMVIPLVTIAFLLTYVHKYTWRSWNAGQAQGSTRGRRSRKSAAIPGHPVHLSGEYQCDVFPGSLEQHSRNCLGIPCRKR